MNKFIKSWLDYREYLYYYKIILVVIVGFIFEENINNILNNFSEVSKGLSESNQEIKNILTNFSSISDSLENSNLASTINKIDNIINKINKSEGSLGKLMNDEDLYKNLLSASKEIDELIADVKKNPERYVNISLIGGSKKKTNKFSKTD